MKSIVLSLVFGLVVVFAGLSCAAAGIGYNLSATAIEVRGGQAAAMRVQQVLYQQKIGADPAAFTQALANFGPSRTVAKFSQTAEAGALVHLNDGLTGTLTATPRNGDVYIQYTLTAPCQQSGSLLAPKARPLLTVCMLSPHRFLVLAFSANPAG